jgi:hypothetical protein
MSDTEKENKILGQRLVMTLAVISTAIVIISLNGLATVELTHVSAPCHIIQSDDYAIPDNVLTKGYDVIRTPDPETGEAIISYDCYYIKNSTLIERLVYNWW